MQVGSFLTANMSWPGLLGRKEGRRASAEAPGVEALDDEGKCT